MASTDEGLTVDKNEIKHFNNLEKTWWDLSGSLEILHRFNILRVSMIIQELVAANKITLEKANSKTPLKGFHILDVGCGGGILSETLAKYGAHVTGLDAASELIKCAKIHAKDLKYKLTYVCDLIENFCKNNIEKFDIVIASEVVEHVQSVELFLESLLKTLKPGGITYITTINRTFKSWLIAIIIFEYIFGYLPKGTHNWNKFVTPDELKNILNKNNCKVTILNGWTYSHLLGKWSFTSDISSFYYLQAIKQE